MTGNHTEAIIKQREEAVQAARLAWERKRETVIRRDSGPCRNFDGVEECLHRWVADPCLACLDQEAAENEARQARARLTKAEADLEYARQAQGPGQEESGFKTLHLWNGRIEALAGRQVDDVVEEVIELIKDRGWSEAILYFNEVELLFDEHSTAGSVIASYWKGIDERRNADALLAALTQAGEEGQDG